MGNAAAGLLFVLSIDPLFVVITFPPSILKTMAYMDDVAAAVSLHGAMWFQLAIDSYAKVGPMIT